MRTSAPPLLPIFRSDLQARILLRVLVDADSSTASALARVLGEPEPTVHREVRRLLDAGLLRSTAVGRARLLAAAADNPATAPLRELLLVTYGPATVLARALQPVPGIDAAYIHGSWAARASGRPGPPPGDVDLLVVGSPDRRAVHRAIAGTESELRREVNVTFATAERWAAHNEPFLATVHSQPLVQLALTADAPTVPAWRGTRDDPSSST